jgi:hypothetical protein
MQKTGLLAENAVFVTRLQLYLFIYSGRRRVRSRCTEGDWMSPHVPEHNRVGITLYGRSLSPAGLSFGADKVCLGRR